MSTKQEPSLVERLEAAAKKPGTVTVDLLREAAAALRATTGEGEWAVVPRNVTRGMWEATFECQTYVAFDRFQRDYAAMLAAAPPRGTEMGKTNLPPLPEPEIRTVQPATEVSDAYWRYTFSERQMHEYAARAVREAVPDGMVLVPREPTEAMIEAGDEFYPWTRGTESRRAMPAPETIYAAMIAAATTQDQENGS